jgi:ketosteroid isomerase-like protein
MAGGNVEVVERWYEAYNARDLEQLLALMHPDVDATSAGMSGVEGGGHIGHSGITRYFIDLWETWEDPRVEVEQMLERDGVVVMLGHTTGTGRLSGMNVVEPVATLVTVEDGVITHYRTYRDWQVALELVRRVDSPSRDA